jgi:hypothetical protein
VQEVLKEGGDEMKLYSIPADLDRLVNNYESLLAESQGEFTDGVAVAEEELKAYLRESADKIEAAIAVVKNLDSDAEQLRDEEKRLAERRHSLEANSERLQRLVSNVLDVAFNGKVKTPKYTAWNQDYKGGVNVGIVDGSDVSKLYRKMPELFNPPQLSKQSVKDFIETHLKRPKWLIVEELPGKRSLRIK